MPSTFSGADGELLRDDAIEPAIIHEQPGTAESLALSPSPAEPRLHSLHDQAPFELGDGGDDREHGLPEG
jgi:hypothetical protein